MYIPRAIEPLVTEAARYFPVVALLGCRQSGKTTLAQHAFPDHAYISLEDYNVREEAESDPRMFLHTRPSARGLIIDEVQHAPKLLSYIQTIVDAEKKNGFFVLTGSQNILVNQKVSQSLAGRVAILTLLPLSLSEIIKAGKLPEPKDEMILRGGYPKVYASDVPLHLLYSSYLRTYVERDIRQLSAIKNLSLFAKFLGLCAGRIGQVVNFSSLANDVGVSPITIREWISLLEATYIIFQLQPYYKNFGKRLIKSPKLYFVDTGLACSLLNITSSRDLRTHYLQGALFENLIISDLLKQQYSKAVRPSLYFWRDLAGHEIDCIVEEHPHPKAIEIKSASTITQTFFKELLFWNKLNNNGSAYVVYGGTEEQKRSQGTVVSWRSAGLLLEKDMSEMPLAHK